MWRKILNHHSAEHPHNMELDDQNQNQSSVLYLFPWGEFLTLLGFTIIFMIEVLQGTSEVEEYDVLPSRNPQSGNYLEFIFWYYCNLFSLITNYFKGFILYYRDLIFQGLY
jgi:hypothetical protein